VILNGGGTFEVWWVYHYDKHQILNTNASYSSLGGGMDGEENRHQSSGCRLREQIFISPN
jgi:hypothetical protein